MTIDELTAGLPGEALVRAGLADLEAGRRTVPALVVAVAQGRFIRAGLLRSPSATHGDAELELYHELRREGGDAYSRYNALIRELTSFERALEGRLRRNA